MERDPLVDVLSAAPHVALDLRYATPRNLLGAAVYAEARAFLRRSTAEKLARAADAVRPRRLLLFDAYRPLSVQRRLWAAKPDPRFVADPNRGSAHNRGGAVDVGLADAAGRALPMPCGFDELVPEAAHGAPGVPAEAAANAARLREAMESAGFRSLAEEWWHYQDPAADGWPLLDVPFEELAR